MPSYAKSPRLAARINGPVYFRCFLAHVHGVASCVCVARDDEMPISTKEGNPQYTEWPGSSNTCTYLVYYVLPMFITNCCRVDAV